MKRLALACALLALIALALPVRRANAVPSDFAITSLNCSSAPGTIQVVNNGGNQALYDNGANDQNISIKFIPAGAASAPIFSINAALGGTNSTTTPLTYQVLSGGILNLQVGPGATTSPSPGPPSAPPGTALSNPQQIALTSSSLLQPGTTVELTNEPPSGGGEQVIDSAVCPPSLLSRTLTVSTAGFDFISAGVPNSVCGPDLPAGTSPSTSNPGPCFTIANALTWARDGDTIVVEAGIYEVCAPIEVNKLVTITSQGAKTILHSYSGQTVFHVTALGGGNAGVPGTTAVGPASISEHAAINGFEIGGVTQPGA